MTPKRPIPDGVRAAIAVARLKLGPRREPKPKSKKRDAA